MWKGKHENAQILVWWNLLFKHISVIFNPKTCMFYLSYKHALHLVDRITVYVHTSLTAAWPPHDVGPKPSLCPAAPHMYYNGAYVVYNVSLVFRLTSLQANTHAVISPPLLVGQLDPTSLPSLYCSIPYICSSHIVVSYLHRNNNNCMSLRKYLHK